MNLLRVADPRSGARLCEAQRFMVPMRDREVVETLHDPSSRGRWSAHSDVLSAD